MNGNAELPTEAPGAYRFLRRFEAELRVRSSYRRFQVRHPYWSVWSTGTYTFAPYKVVWREMSGGKFVAAYIGRVRDVRLGEKVVIPDHKLYFVPFEAEREAAFVCGILNAPSVARAIGAYASQLSLGVSVIEYLKLPRYAEDRVEHLELAEMAILLTTERRTPSTAESRRLDVLALHVLRG